MQRIAACVRSTSELTGVSWVRRGIFHDNVHETFDRCGGRGRPCRSGNRADPLPLSAAGPRPAGLRLLSPAAGLRSAGYGQPGYGQPGYGYQNQNSLGAIIGQLLGNRYNVTDRTAVQQCASAAMAQANAQYRPQNGYGQPPYGNAYGYNNNRGYNQGYNPMMRVTAITNVERQPERPARLRPDRQPRRLSAPGPGLWLPEPGLCSDRRPQLPLQRRLSRRRHQPARPPRQHLSRLAFANA